MPVFLIWLLDYSIIILLILLIPKRFKLFDFICREYLVERTSQSKSTLAWYHRQFQEAAHDKYCSPEVVENLHRDVAFIFTVTDK